MSQSNTISQQLYDLLVSRDLDPKALDAMGNASSSPADADLFSVDYKTSNRNYGTVVILLDTDNNMQLYYGDSLGKTMEQEDKNEWYDFLYILRMLAKRNMYKFSLNNMNKLKHNMATMAAVTEGTLLEGYYGSRKVSYNDQPMKTRLIIKHTRPLGEGEARFRNIDTIFVETSEGERFKLPFRNLSGSKAMARHISEGGTPYDAFGQHIIDTVEQIGTLNRFNRAAKTKTLNDSAQHLAEQAVEHYKQLKKKIKRIIGRKGYKEELENFDPISVTDIDEAVENVRELFVQQSLDSRIEQALPILAKIEETNMKESQQFEQWADSIVEGTWAVPDTEEEKNQLRSLMAEPLIVGADATNATEQLYGILGDDQLFDDLQDLADRDPNADARPIVQARMEEMGIVIDDDEVPTQPDVTEITDIDSGEQVLKAQKDPMLEDELEQLIKLLK